MLCTGKGILKISPIQKRYQVMGEGKSCILGSQNVKYLSSHLDEIMKAISPHMPPTASCACKQCEVQLCLGYQGRLSKAVLFLAFLFFSSFKEAVCFTVRYR